MENFEGEVKPIQPKKVKKPKKSREEQRKEKEMKLAIYKAGVAQRIQDRELKKKRRLEEYKRICRQREEDEILLGFEVGELGRPTLHPPRKRIRLHVSYSCG